MDELHEFLSLSENFKRIPVQPGYVNGRVLPEANKSDFIKKREVKGTEYGEKYKEAELRDMIRVDNSMSSKLDKLSTIDDIDSDESIDVEPVDDVYRKYDFERMLPDLPIVDMKDAILHTIAKNPVVILEGATGCGKTTQVPQFILDDGYARGKRVNIVVTQPRRIAAISIARRVCFERGMKNLPFPNLIGYQIGLKLATCEDTRITYVTTGVLLEKLIATKTLLNYTHIILDEVHERSQDMDFLFIIIKKLQSQARNVKIILMSATIDSLEFSAYFKFIRNGCFQPAPVIKVDRKNNFTVSEFYLCDLKKIMIKMQNLDLFKPSIEENMYNIAVKLLYVFTRIDYMDELSSVTKPTILIFLPGIYEISCMAKCIEDSRKTLSHSEFIVIVLHSLLTQEEQAVALKKPSDGKRIIILATNIAESSITVPNVKYVIDFCLTKCLVTDSTTNFTSLQLEWCSRSNCRQRAGRTGRTMDGRVYRLVPKHFYENSMDETSKPEMCRSPLEKVVLKAKQLDMGSPESILALAMDRPRLSDIHNTILLLKEAGALLRTFNGKFCESDGDMTFIGQIMAALPVDIHVAKLVILGHCFSVLPECIIIGAGLTTKSIFAQGFRNAVLAYSKKMVWSDGSGSDLFAILKAYRSYEYRKQNYDRAKSWADRYYLNEKSLIEMSHLIAEIQMRLERLGIKERTSVSRAKWTNAEMSIILKVVIAGSFYPNYFVRSTDESNDRDAFRALNGRNPCNTVYFGGFDEKFIRPLYTQSIKKAMAQCTNSPDNVKVTFDDGNEKVFVTFKQTNASLQANIDTDLNFVEGHPGQVCAEVYKALKMKKSGSVTIRVMHPKDAARYGDEIHAGKWNKGKWEFKKKIMKNIEMVCLPRRHVSEVLGKITHYDTDFNRFWFRSNDEDILFNEIQNELNSLNRDHEKFSNYGSVEVGQIVAAPYNDMYYRAQILLNFRATNGIFYKVLFVDIGMEGQVEFSDLRRLRGVSAKFIDVPGRVFECRLASIQPSELHTVNGWEPTMKRFMKMTRGVQVCAEIFSVENNIASVFITVRGESVRTTLINEGYARTAEENFMSKVDHDLRIRTQSNQFNQLDEDCEVVAEEIRKMIGFDEEYEVPEPEPSKCHIKVTLKGPMSPLESRLYSCLSMTTRANKVVIEVNSVNSVLLDGNPQDLYEKFVVAANVTENQNGTELIARETTIMPNIPGFGPIMALIFSPYCEFFRDKYKSRFTTIICGLGEHPEEKRPIYAEHDAVFNLDTEIDIEDIENINMIRFSIDTLLRMSPDQKYVTTTEHDQKQLTVKIKQAIIALLEKERPLVGVQYNSNIGWSKYDPRDVIRGKDIYGTAAIYPFHNILSLASADSPSSLEQLLTLTENNKMLHSKSRLDTSFKRPIKCLLCNVDLESVYELKIHLHTRLHTDRERRINYHNNY